MAGSILGGRWSDRVLRKLKASNGGQGRPEVSFRLMEPTRTTESLITVMCQMRLESTKLAMVFMPLSCIAYGWLCEEHVHIAAVTVALFFCGFFCMSVFLTIMLRKR